MIRAAPGRRVRAFGGTPYPGGCVERTQLPPFLQAVERRIGDLTMTLAADGAHRNRNGEAIDDDAEISIGRTVAAKPFDFVLLNAYTDGGGIAPHSDGPMYEERVAIVSFGGGDGALLEFGKTKTTTAESAGSRSEGDGDGGDDWIPLGSVRLEPGSLLIFEGDAYREPVKHRIRASSDTAQSASSGRLSLTFRTMKRKEKESHLLSQVPRVTGEQGKDGDGLTDFARLMPEEQRELLRKRAWFRSSISE